MSIFKDYINHFLFYPFYMVHWILCRLHLKQSNTILQRIVFSIDFKINA